MVKQKAIVMAGFAVALIVLSGCTNNVRFFENDDFPNVEVDTSDDRYKLHSKILNQSDTLWPANELGVAMRADFATDKENNCVVEHTYNVYQPVAPDNGTFTFNPIAFDDPPLENVGPDCNRCLKNECGGVVQITLIRLSSGDRMPGPKTKYRILWSKNGDPAQIVEVEN